MLALVTGGNRGIGFAIAQALAKDGKDIVVCGRNNETLENAKQEIGKLGVKAWAFQCDVSNDKDLENLADEVSKIGDLGILINNAGVAYNKEFLENTQEEIDSMINVNLRGLINCTKAFLPAMKQRGKGTIINISSGAGKTGFPGLAVYCATKFGVIGFTEALAGEVSSDGIGVYAICPGATQSDMWESLFPGRPATYVPEDVAIELMELLKNIDKIEPGKAIDVRKHI